MDVEFAQKVTKGQICDGSISQNIFYDMQKLCAKCHAFVKKVHNYLLYSSTIYMAVIFICKGNVMEMVTNGK